MTLKLVAKLRCATCMILFDNDVEATEHLNTEGNEHHEFTIRYIGTEEEEGEGE